MSRASQPPMMKKISAAAPYMMPIFLWSTVNSHRRQRALGLVGRDRAPSGSNGAPPAPAGRASG